MKKLTFIIFTLFSFSALAQPGFDPAPPLAGEGIPITGGLLYFLIAGLAIGVRLLMPMKRK